VKALKIAEKPLLQMHPDLVSYHLALSQLLIILKHHDLSAALDHAHKALEIANNVFPSDHSQLKHTYLMLSEIYNQMRDVEQSIIWFNKAEAFDGLQSTDIYVQKMLARRKMFICNRCHRLV